MARTVLDYNVVEDKANSLETSANNMMDKYDEMLATIEDITKGMSGETVETQARVFREMQPTFEQMKSDILAKAAFLKKYVERFKSVEQKGAQEAAEQGRFDLNS